MSEMEATDQTAMSRLLFYVLANGWQVIPTGSRAIGGWTPESDWDYVVCALSGTKMHLNDFLVAEGYEPGGSERDGGAGYSWRRGNINVIVVTNSFYRDKWAKATEVARVMGVRTKNARVAVFGHIFEDTTMRCTLEDQTEVGIESRQPLSVELSDTW
jgi:hypothetical protein